MAKTANLYARIEPDPIIHLMSGLVKRVFHSQYICINNANQG